MVLFETALFSATCKNREAAKVKGKRVRGMLKGHKRFRAFVYNKKGNTGVRMCQDGAFYGG